MEKLESIPLNEQETTISFWRDEEHATLWTNDRTAITRLDKRYRISDKGLLSFKPRKRVISEEQKAALVERLKRAE